MASVRDFAQASEFDILGGPLGPVEIGATGVRAVIQNVRTILATVRGTVPLDRTFGIDDTIVDTPAPVAQARLTGAVIEAVERWEPRVKVVKVTWVRLDNSETADGRMVPRVRVKIRGTV